MNSGWKSSSCNSSSAPWKWSGKDAGEVLQSFTAQVTKLAVSTFMVLAMRCLLSGVSSVSQSFFSAEEYREVVQRKDSGRPKRRWEYHGNNTCLSIPASVDVRILYIITCPHLHPHTLDTDIHTCIHTCIPTTRAPYNRYLYVPA